MANKAVTGRPAVVPSRQRMASLIASLVLATAAVVGLALWTTLAPVALAAGATIGVLAVFWPRP
jgi:hypothetical protein